MTRSKRAQAVVRNVSWLSAESLIRSGVGLFVGILVARYLGPAQYGILNYSLAIVGIAASVTSLGLGDISVRNIVQDRQHSHEILGTVFVIQGLAGLVAVGMVNAAVHHVHSGDLAIKATVALVSGMVVLRSTDVFKFWFDSQQQSYLVAWATIGAFGLASTAKVYLVWTNAQLPAFASMVVIELLLVSVFLAFFYAHAGHHLSKWRASAKMARKLIAASWPLALTSISIMVYMRVDQLMIGYLIGDEAVGVYSIAVRLVELWYFVPVAMTVSMFPVILDLKNKNESSYKMSIQQLLNAMAVIGLAVALPVTLLADWVVPLLFGMAYQGAADVLQVSIWAGIFVAVGVASSKWFIAEGLQRYSFYRALAGCFVNVSLNLVWIPKYGLLGAAWATVVAQGASVVLFNCIASKTRSLFWMQIRALSGSGWHVSSDNHDRR